MRGRDCDFWIFQAFPDKYGNSESNVLFLNFPEALKDSWLDKSLGTFYESLKKYGTKNIKKVINLLYQYYTYLKRAKNKLPITKN